MFRWLIHRKSTVDAQVIQPATVPVDVYDAFRADFLKLRERVHRLEINDKERSESLDVLEAALHKLRGQVMGVRGGRPPKGPPAPGDKEALREYVGLRAGRAPPHGE